MNLFQAIQEADRNLRPFALETPLEESGSLSRATGATVLLKGEHLQRTGSFKFRGAMNKVLSLGPREKAVGVVAASSGNHGQGVALACHLANIQARLFVPLGIDPVKEQAIRHWGASLDFLEGDSLAAELEARAVAQQQGQTFISPYNDLTVIAGQGTIGVELLRQDPRLDAVFVSVGGGGLSSGIASYLKQARPGIRKHQMD